MTLVKLLEGLNVLSTNADLNIEVSDIKIHSQSVDDGDIFICMKGVKDDGNKYLNQIKKSFVAIVAIVPFCPDKLGILISPSFVTSANG